MTTSGDRGPRTLLCRGGRGERSGEPRARRRRQLLQCIGRHASSLPRGCDKKRGPLYLWRMRLTDFWDRMGEQFGPAYAESLARDHVIAGLGSKTVAQALADGDDAKFVWRAVCDEFEVPARYR